jgi:hypothetical protein
MGTRTPERAGRRLELAAAFAQTYQQAFLEGPWRSQLVALGHGAEDASLIVSPEDIVPCRYCRTPRASGPVPCATCGGACQ